MTPRLVCARRATQFFGKHWIAGAAEAAKDKDQTMAKAHDDEWLAHQMNIHLKRLREARD